MILGKIYLENGEKARSQRLLRRAERIADRAGNRINLADVKMVWGLWQQRFGNPKEQIKTLASALRIFRDLKEFDTAQKEHYMESCFPDVWPDVLKAVKSQANPLPPRSALER
jgi:tetratricopeptide (TPR) repeat protein